MAKRTKQVQTMVDEVNKNLEQRRVIDISDEYFSFMSWLLLTANCYHGFNWFYYEPYTDVVGNTTLIPRLAGTGAEKELKEKDAFIQLY